MKHTFLLDENILHHAVKGVDSHDNPDRACTEVVLLIARNCHSMVADVELFGRYQRRLAIMSRVPAPIPESLSLLRELMKNSAKVRFENSEPPPELPAGTKVPAEDVPVVRAALRSQPIVVTADEELREAINSQPGLGLRAVTPAEALELARDQ